MYICVLCVIIKVNVACSVLMHMLPHTSQKALNSKLGTIATVDVAQCARQTGGDLATSPSQA